MTRLTENDLQNLQQELYHYDLDLLRKTGLSIKQIAGLAAGIGQNKLDSLFKQSLVAVIPVTVGEGLIQGFVQSVSSIIRYMGCEVFVSENTDVSGIAEAIDQGADILFMADDNRFIALNKHNGIMSDNAEATGKGYVSALNAMAEGLAGRDVFVIGAGKVGKHAINALCQYGAKIKVYDTDPEKVIDLKDREDITIESDFLRSLKKYKYIIDATPEAAFLDYKWLNPEVMIAAPGIPFGLTTETYDFLSNKVIHDPLQIGVATMLALALK